MGLEREGDWVKAQRLFDSLPGRARDAIDKAILQELNFLRKKIVEEFQQGAPVTGSWAPHSPMTKAIRALVGNVKSKLLIQSASLRNSVGVIPIRGGGGFVGVRRGATTKASTGIVNLAMVHELGATIHVRMTPKMRRLLFAAMARAGMSKPRAKGAPGASGAAMVKITIPARPYLDPVFSVYGRPEDLERSIMARVAILLGGDVGEAGKPRE